MSSDQIGTVSLRDADVSLKVTWSVGVDDFFKSICKVAFVLSQPHENGFCSRIDLGYESNLPALLSTVCLMDANSINPEGNWFLWMPQLSKR
jgi:hypothetical protein